MTGGFREFTGTPRPGDMVMQVQSKKWNHAGILQSGNMLLHHLQWSSEPASALRWVLAG